MSILNITWKSKAYRKWMRDNCDCFVCGQPLIHESEGFTSHHYRPKNLTSTGGKETRDYYLTNLCLSCHNDFHLNKPKFMKDNSLLEKDFLHNAAKSLFSFLLNQNKGPELCELLGVFCKDNNL